MKITKFHKQIFREAAKRILTGYNYYCCSALELCAQEAPQPNKTLAELHSIFFAFYHEDSGYPRHAPFWHSGEAQELDYSAREARVFALLTICQFNHTP